MEEIHIGTYYTM